MIEYLPILMFVALAFLLFSGYPVAWVLGGVGLAFGFIGVAAGEFLFIQFNTLPSRIFGSIMESLVLTAVPMFVFMGMMLERSGIARDLLNCLTVLLRRVPGGLALAVTIMGTVLAASTGIIGASVIMMTLLALPVMMERNYKAELACGTIAASGCLGIIIPPSIMLVIMADLMSKSVGTLFVAAVMPGLLLATLYVLYIVIRCFINPSLAPRLPDDIGPRDLGSILVMVVRSFVPPVILIVLVLGSIIGGLATPTEAAGIGAMGAMLLAFVNLAVLPSLGVVPLDLTEGSETISRNSKLSFRANLSAFWNTFREVIDNTAQTNAMIFGIFIGATLFSYIFRALGGDDVIVGAVNAMNMGSWGLLILILALVFILGFFFDWIEITLIVLPVFAPVIANMDFGGHVDTFEVYYWLLILIAINLQTSFLTPPFGFALFYLKSVAPKGISLQQIYRGIVPFVILQLIALGIVLLFPKVALWLPHELIH